MGSSSMSTGQRLHSVFVYGSLLADEVVTVLLKRVPDSSPAILHDFHRFSIKGRIYPAILPVENKKVTGRLQTKFLSNPLKEGPFKEQGHKDKKVAKAKAKNHVTQVLSGITDPELDVLDTFEDVEYERRTIEVSLMDSSQKLTAYAYVWANINDPNLYGDWHFEEWRQAHMKDFVNMTAGFMEELELPESKPRVETYESFFQQSGDSTPMS